MGEATRNDSEKAPAFAFSLDDPSARQIDNEEFLESYVRLGAWLRLIQAFDALKTIRQTNDSAHRLAATAAIFSALGALVEDVNATLLAWICWNKNSQLRLADILFNASFVRDAKQTPGDAFLDGVVSLLSTGKRARVDPQAFAKTLLSKDARAVLRLVGLDWKAQPSVKVARGDELILWAKLPTATKQTLEVLASGSTVSISLAYNKIKHGPQVLVSNLVDYLQETGADEEMLRTVTKSLRLRGLSPNTLRILFKGSETKRTVSGDLATLWLDDDTEAIEALVAFDFFLLGKLPWLVAMWIRKARYGRDWFAPPPVVVELEQTVGRIRDSAKAKRLFSQLQAPAI